MKKQDLLNLKKRYLVWLYKTTKEAWDKIERKFTQLESDKFILQELKKNNKSKKAAKFIAEFEAYILNKEMDGLSLKYEGKELKPEYYFLDLKLAAVEKAVIKELGKKGLAEIKSLYEKEMLERILKSTEPR
jgi:hypothetical protein